MSKKKDWISLGEAYKDVFSKVVVSEDVPAGEVGEAPLEPGGPQERGGFRPSQIDINRMSEKDNLVSVLLVELFLIMLYLLYFCIP